MITSTISKSYFGINQIVFIGNRVDFNKGTVDGINVTIYGGVISVLDVEALNLISQINNPSLNCTAASIINDDSYFYNYLTNNSGPFKVISIIMAICTMIITSMYVILVDFVLTKDGCKSFGQIKTIVLIIEIISNGFRFVFLIDPFGIYGNIPYIISRTSFTIQGPCNIFCSFTLLLVWLDALASINASMKMKKRTSIIASNKGVRYSLLSILGFLIVMNVFAEWYDFGYDSTGNVTTYQALFLFVMELFVCLLSFRAVIYRYSNAIQDSSGAKLVESTVSKINPVKTESEIEVGKISSKIAGQGVPQKAVSPGSTKSLSEVTPMGPTNQNTIEIIKKKVETTTKWILVSSVCTMLLLVFLIFVGLGYHLGTPEAFSVLMLGAMVIGTLCSYAQFKIAEILLIKEENDREKYKKDALKQWCECIKGIFQ